MSVYENYLTAVQRQIDEVTRRQRSAIETTSRWVAEALVRKRYLFVFGTGHSHMLAEELFYRAGDSRGSFPFWTNPSCSTDLPHDRRMWSDRPGMQTKS